MRVMFDTNALNAFIKRSLPLPAVASVQYFCTNLQEAELRSTANPDVREALLTGFSTLNSALATERLDQFSTPWGSPWDSPWDRGGEHYTALLSGLEARKPRDRGNSYDAALLETAKYEGLVLVTDDSAVLEVADSAGIVAMRLETFVALPPHAL